jgi:RNA polymerase sigma-70 factor (ECF subfamily)
MLLSLNGDIPEQREQSSQMVELAQPGDSRAFAALFHEYNAPICAYLARMVGNDEAGRDLAQETFLHAWRSLPTISGKLQFKPWLYRIATNLARSHMRHERLIRWLPWGEHTEVQQSVGPEEDVSENECIRQALAQLAPRCRACLLLQVVGGFSQREIASMLAISEKSVSAYVSRGREQFRHYYRQVKGISA